MEEKITIDDDDVIFVKETTAREKVEDEKFEADDDMTKDNITSVEQIMRDRRSGSDIDATPDFFFIAEEKDSQNLRNEIINLCDDERTKYLIRQKTTKIFFEKRQNDIIGFLLFSKIDDDFNSLIIHEVCIEKKNFKQFFKSFKKAFNNPSVIFTDTTNKKTKKMLEEHKFKKIKDVFMQDFSLVLKR